MRKKKTKVESPKSEVYVINQDGALQPEVQPVLETITVPPFSLDFNYGMGTRTIVLPNGMDILMVAKIYTDLLDKYEVQYEVIEKSNQE